MYLSDSHNLICRWAIYLLGNMISICVAHSIMSVSNGFEICKVLITKYSKFGTFLLLFFSWANYDLVPAQK